MVLENNTTDEEFIGPTTSSLVSDILTKYNLKESQAEEYTRIMEKGETPNAAVVQILAKSFASNLISEKDFVTSLVDKLKISNEIAENFVRDISDKVVPYIKSLPKSRPAVVEQTSINRTEPPEYNLDTKLPPQPEIIKKIPDFKPRPQANQTNIARPKGPDSYREPIE